MRAEVATAASSWTDRRRRAEDLRERYPFTAEILTLYLALLPAQAEAWRAAREREPSPAELPRWAVARVLPSILEATAAAASATLRAVARSRGADGAPENVLAAWLAGADLNPVDRYLARASLAPVLEALGERAGDACAPVRTGQGGALCPCCGGLPQLSWVAATGESLVTGRRNLLCARCTSSWDYTRSACPACGETDESRLLVYTEHWSGPASINGNGAAPAVFPHLRIVGCETCRRYLIEVDMARDGRAVPEVDELAALPLDLYAADQGLTKLTPNLMGF